MSTPILSPASRFRYEGVREALLQGLMGLKEGDRLPPERALSTHFKVDRSTVRRAMEELTQEGFVVRHQGRGTFVNRKTGKAARSTPASMVAFSVPGIEVPIHRRFIKAIEQEVVRYGASLLICNAQDSTDQERRNLKQLAGQDIRDIIIMPFFDDSLREEYIELINSLKQAGKRIVLFDQYIPELDVPVAMSNRPMIGYMATEHLIMLGHSRVAYATSGKYDAAGKECLKGYQRALADYGLAYNPDLVIEKPLAHSAAPVGDAVKEMLKGNPKAFTAIATEHFSMTYGIVMALESMGLKADRDIGVVGAELYQNPALLYLTHTVQRIDEMGRSAVKLLLDPPSETMQKHVLIPPRLVAGKVGKDHPDPAEAG